ncbi:MAG: hypothetical protein V1899_06840, partial [Planctomycetota bacterium]
MNLRYVEYVGYVRFSRLIAATLALGVLSCLAPAAQAAERYWVGAGTGGGGVSNWSDSANWSDASGGAGGSTIPQNDDKVFFDGGGIGNCIINTTTSVPQASHLPLDSNVTVKRIEISANYPGVVIQGAGITVTTGSMFIASTFRLGVNSKLQLTDTGTPL